MLRGCKLLAIVMAAIGFGVASLVGAPTASAQDTFNQIELTDKHITSYIAAQADMAAFAQRNPAPEGTAPNEKQQAELDAISKKHGFKDFAEFDDVAYNISVVLSGIDPQSGQYTDPVTAIKKEIADITADAQIPAAEKKQMLDELNDALKNTPALKFPGNVAVVTKHREAIEKALQQ